MKKLFAILIMLLMFSQSHLFAGQGNAFVFTQLKYNGKWDPYPEVWQDILEFMVTTTNLKCQNSRRVVTINDPLLFASPFIVILGSEEFPTLTDSERTILRKYLSNGGIIFAEDSSGLKAGRFDSGFRTELAKIFPELKLKKLPIEHPLYRAYYLLRKTGGRRINNNYIEGLSIGQRTGVVYSQNDLFGAWAKDRFGNYLWECLPSGTQQRFESQKMTQNIIMYAVTGTYKSDAIHQPYIQMKLRR